MRLANNSQIDFILGLAATKQRMDNRKEFDGFRDIKVEYGVSVNAEGSARVRLGKTDVIAGVKLEVGEPFADTPDEGVIIVNAEFPPIASPDFEPGPPREDAIELARVVDRGIRESQALDLKKLCIKKGEKTWMVYIDVYILNHAGNLLDASTIAAVAALKDTKFPKVDKEYKVQFGEKTEKNLPLQRVPISCTFAKIADKILLDPSLKEEELMSARLTITCSDDMVHAMQKGLQWGFKASEIENCVDMAMSASKAVRKLLK